MEKLILIVDDSDDDVFLLRRLLTRSGIVNRAHFTFDPKDATAYLDGSGQYSDRQQWPLPSILMLDLKLPGVNGFEFLEWCRAHRHCKEALIIVLSGSGEIPAIKRAYALGAHSFLVNQRVPAIWKT